MLFECAKMLNWQCELPTKLPTDPLHTHDLRSMSFPTKHKDVFKLERLGTSNADRITILF